MSKSTKQFQNEMEKHLIEFKTNTQYLPPLTKKKWLYHDIADNLFPPIRHGFLQYVYDRGMPLHEYVNHVRSSQVFCVNVFYYLLVKEQNRLLQLLSRKINKKLDIIESYEFEFSATTNILGEWRSDDNRPEEYVTAADLFIIAKSKNGIRYGFIIEVKFTEGEFNKCGGYLSNANKGNFKEACESGKKLIGDLNTCFLAGAKSKSKLRRKYFDFLTDKEFNTQSFNNDCPFKFNHQCLRNHSLIRALIKEKKINKGYFLLIYHDDNQSIKKEWETYFNILSDDAKDNLIKIPVSEIVNVANDKYYKKYFQDRYKIS